MKGRVTRLLPKGINRLFPIWLFGWGFLELAFAAEPASERALFLDVVVSNRVFSGQVSAPQLIIRTRQPYLLDVLVYDSQDRLVAVVSSDRALNEWTCGLDHLPPVAKGLYFFYIAASDEQNHLIALYPPVFNVGELVKVSDLKVEADKAVIRYGLPKASFVRIRVGIDGGPYLDPILRWQVQLAGEQTIPWDGSAQSNLFRNLNQRQDVRVIALAVAIPVNLLASQDSPIVPVGVPGLLRPTRLKGLSVPSSKGMMPESSRLQPTCLVDDYSLTLAVLQPEPQTVAFQVNCVPADEARLMNERFELMLFVDGVFIMEDEVSLLPFTYTMSTRGLADGNHLITVNIVDTHGVLGTISKMFNVKNQEPSPPPRS